MAGHENGSLQLTPACVAGGICWASKQRSRQNFMFARGQYRQLVTQAKIMIMPSLYWGRVLLSSLARGETASSTGHRGTMAICSDHEDKRQFKILSVYSVCNKIVDTTEAHTIDLDTSNKIMGC